MSFSTAKPLSTPSAISTEEHGAGSRVACSCGTHCPLTIFHNADGSAARQLTTSGSGGHFMRWTADGKGLFLSARTPSGARIVRLDVASGTMDSLAPISSGAHISLSPRQDRILDVRNHKTIWVHPLDGAEAYQVFEFPDPDIRIDYPVIFDRAAPSGGDIWLLEGLE